MTKPDVRVRAVPEGAQVAVARAIAELEKRLQLDPEAITVTRIDFLDPAGRGGKTYPVGLLAESGPNYRIFLLAKGTQYVMRTAGRGLVLEEERFVGL